MAEDEGVNAVAVLASACESAGAEAEELLDKMPEEIKKMQTLLKDFDKLIDKWNNNARDGISQDGEIITDFKLAKMSNFGSDWGKSPEYLKDEDDNNLIADSVWKSDDATPINDAILKIIDQTGPVFGIAVTADAGEQYKAGVQESNASTNSLAAKLATTYPRHSSASWKVEGDTPYSPPNYLEGYDDSTKKCSEQAPSAGESGYNAQAEWVGTGFCAIANIFSPAVSKDGKRIGSILRLEAENFKDIRDREIAQAKAGESPPSSVIVNVGTIKALERTYKEIFSQQEVILDLINAFNLAVAGCIDDLEDEAKKCTGTFAWVCDKFLWGPTEEERAAMLAAADDLKDLTIGDVAEFINYAGTRNFKEQCYLLAKIFELTKYKKETLEAITPKKLPYYSAGSSNIVESNACLMVDGHPYGFLNQLTQSPTQEQFFNMETSEISTLQPMVRFFKVDMSAEKNEKELVEQEYIFDSNTTNNDIERFLADKATRGVGVGVKDFSFVYEGNTPFAVKKSIKAKLTIFANSFNELMIDRGGYSYIELALKTGRTNSASDTSSAAQFSQENIDENLSKLNFRLKALVGWAKPSGSPKPKHFSSHLLDALDDSFMTLNLTPVTHEFNIDQQGRVNFTIDYLAYVDDYFDHPYFNIFSDSEISLDVLTRTLKYKNLEKKCKPEDLAKIKKTDLKSGIIESQKKRSLTKLISNLLDKDKIKYINIKYEDIRNFQSSGPYDTQEGENGENKLKFGSVMDSSPDSRSLVENMAIVWEQTQEKNKPEDGEENRNLAIAESDNPNWNDIPFFYISDILDIILEGIETNLKTLEGVLANHEPIQMGIYGESIDLLDVTKEVKKIEKAYVNFKKLRVMLGPLEIVNPKIPNESAFVNIGDIPVSVKYFTEWMTVNLIAKEQAIYPLSRFLTDFFNCLIRGFLNNKDCFSGIIKQKTTLMQSVVTSYKDIIIDEDGKSTTSPYDEITKKILSPPRGDYKITDPTKPLSRMQMSLMPQPILNVSGIRGSPLVNPGVDREVNYLIFSAGRTQPAELMQGRKNNWYSAIKDEQGNESEVLNPGDHSRGIFHYILGKNKGIIKSIELSKTNSKFLKEVRFEQEGFRGLEQLREVYDVNITTYANVKAFPGVYIYVDPHGFAPSSMVNGEILDLTQFGIGGYCMIYRSEHTFAAGQAETKITAKWVASISAKLSGEIPAVKDKDENDNINGVNSNNKICGNNNRKEAAKDTGWMKLVTFFSDADEESADSVGVQQ